jgi:hypothetical protein
VGVTIACVALTLISADVASASPIATPVSATLNTPLAEGWVSSVCGGFIPEICVDPVYDHILTVNFLDGSTASFLARADPSGALSSIHDLRMQFIALEPYGMTLAALHADFSPYSTTSYDLFETGGVIYEDFDFTPFNPMHYLLTIPDLSDPEAPDWQFRLLGDGGLQFTACQVTATQCVPVAPIPEPATAVLLLTGVAGIRAIRLRTRRRRSSLR